MKICPICGAENSNNSIYCEKCGKAFRGKKELGGTVSIMPIIIVGLLSVVLIAGCVVLLIRNLNPDSVPSSSPTTAVTAAIAEPESDAETNLQYILPEQPPEKYYYHNSHTYGFYDVSRYGFTTYEQVSDFCHSQGGHLAVINDRSENVFLYDLMRENYKTTVFFGYTDKDEEGAWLWDGDESDYENWTRSGKWDLPDNGAMWGGGEWAKGGEDYAEFNYDREENWGAPNDATWNDANFMQNTSVCICEWEFNVHEAEFMQK